MILTMLQTESVYHIKKGYTLSEFNKSNQLRCFPSVNYWGLAFSCTDKTTISLTLYAKIIQIQAILKFNSIIMRLHKLSEKTDIKIQGKNCVIMG